MGSKFRFPSKSRKSLREGNQELILPNLIMEIMDFLFIALTFVISGYLVRHYIFTITVLRQSKIDKVQRNTELVRYEPTVSILIPAHNEQEVIGKLLEKTVNLSYPKSKFEVIVIDDASTDKNCR